MNRLATVLLMIASVAGIGGCSVAYSSINRQADGTYLLTESKVRFLKSQGTLYHCTASDAGLSCKVVGLPQRK